MPATAATKNDKAFIIASMKLIEANKAARQQRLESAVENLPLIEKIAHTASAKQIRNCGTDFKGDESTTAFEVKSRGLILRVFQSYSGGGSSLLSYTASLSRSQEEPFFTVSGRTGIHHQDDREMGVFIADLYEELEAKNEGKTPATTARIQRLAQLALSLDEGHSSVVQADAWHELSTSWGKV